MFGSFLGKKKESVDDIALKISKMNLTEMRSYVNNKASEIETTQDGLVEVIKKLTATDEKTLKTYLQIDDMDSKKKKGLDLVIMIANSKYISADAVELLQEFTIIYNELIAQYDRDHKEIYASRLTDALEQSINNVNKQSELARKTKVLGE